MTADSVGVARRRDINDIDEDEDGQIVDYSGDSDDGDKPKDSPCDYQWVYFSLCLRLRAIRYNDVVGICVA